MTNQRSESADRRGLSAAVLRVDTFGEERAARVLEQAWLSVKRAVEQGLEEPTRLPLTHGFHSYPARLSPALVDSLLEDLSPGPAVVHDSFCGGGTVPLCALARGLASSAADISPVALMVARARVRCTSARDREVLVARAAEAVEAARQRGGPAGSARLPPPVFRELREWYAPHTLQELTALRAALYRQERDSIGGLLRACFSSLLIKFSYQTSETSRRRSERTHSRGAPSRLLVKRAQELADGLAELARVVPPGTPLPQLVRSDARDTEGLPDAPVGLVVSSPPYPGTYDYGGLQALRMVWLGMESVDRSRGGELGDRASFRRRGESARTAYVRGMAGALRCLEGALAEGAPVVWVVGDGAAQGERVPVLPLLEESAGLVGWSLVARATASRPAFLPGHGETRAEHLLWLSPPG